MVGFPAAVKDKSLPLLIILYCVSVIVRFTMSYKIVN